MIEVCNKAAESIRLRYVWKLEIFPIRPSWRHNSRGSFRDFIVAVFDAPVNLTLKETLSFIFIACRFHFNILWCYFNYLIFFLILPSGSTTREKVENVWKASKHEQCLLYLKWDYLVRRLCVCKQLHKRGLFPTLMAIKRRKDNYSRTLLVGVVGRVLTQTHISFSCLQVVGSDVLHSALLSRRTLWLSQSPVLMQRGKWVIIFMKRHRKWAKACKRGKKR